MTSSNSQDTQADRKLHSLAREFGARLGGSLVQAIADKLEPRLARDASIDLESRKQQFQDIVAALAKRTGAAGPGLGDAERLAAIEQLCDQAITLSQERLVALEAAEARMAGLLGERAAAGPASKPPGPDGAGRATIPAQTHG